MWEHIEKLRQREVLTEIVPHGNDGLPQIGGYSFVILVFSIDGGILRKLVNLVY